MEVSINSAALRHQEEFKVMYQDFITRQHDYKHTLQTLEMLIKQNNIREASNFLIEHTEKEEVRPFITGSLSVDALLTAKQLTMTKYGITLHFTTCPLNVLPLPTPDFCTLLGNVLDNSIEGIQRITDPTIPRVISLTLSRTYQMFHIHGFLLKTIMLFFVLMVMAFQIYKILLIRMKDIPDSLVLIIIFFA